ncbi:MAG: tetratricopeptide repeat protein [Oscillospiraceae bacterium]|jgi:tetratricopeptide (TPR) repeat protein|nr:tetratricopeptide repeat protein [Oscillospiraceae bacterium]
MPLTANKLADIIRDDNRKGKRYCFFLGAGASKESGVPLGGVLADKWLKELKYSDNVSYTKLTTKLGGHGAGELYAEIYAARFADDYKAGYQAIEEALKDADASLGYIYLSHILTETKNNIVITTNFDHLSEETLTIYSHNKHAQVVYHHAQADCIEVNAKHPVVVKLHSDMYNHPISNADDLQTLAPEWQSALAAIFAEYTPVFVGYGGSDPDVMSFLREYAKIRPTDSTLYWCGLSDAPSVNAAEIIAAYDGQYVKIKGFDDTMFILGMALDAKNVVERVEELSRIRVGDFRRKQVELQEEYAKIPDEGKTAEDYFNEGDLLYDNNEYERAIECYNEAVRLAPADDAAYNKRGIAYGKLERYDEAIADITEAIRLDPDYAAAYNNRGIAYGKLERYDEAIADFTEAIRLNPDLAIAYNNRGFLFIKLDRMDEAFRDINEAISLDPNFAEAFDSRGVYHTKLEHYDDAIADFSKTLELNPSLDETYANRAIAYHALGKYDEADADLAKARELRGEA